MKAFKRCHPSVNFIFFAAVIVFSMLLNHPVFIGISLVSALLNAVWLKGKDVLKTFFLFLLPLLIFVTVINALFAHYGVTVLYIFKNGNDLTLEALAYGSATGALVVTMMLWFVSYNEVVTEDKFMHLFGKRMPHLALLILMVLRFVPLYIKQIKEVASARDGMGISQDKGKIRNGLSAISGVITWALENSIETADSMKSRAYGTGRRTSYSRFVMSPADWSLILLMLVMIFAIAFMKASGAVQASYNPAIDFSPASVELVLCAAVYTLFCFVPVIYDLEEDIRWNRLYSKI